MPVIIFSLKSTCFIQNTSFSRPFFLCVFGNFSSLRLRAALLFVCDAFACHLQVTQAVSRLACPETVSLL